MSIYQKVAFATEYLGYDVVVLDRKQHSDFEYFNLKAGDLLIDFEDNQFKISSAVSSALEYGDDPIESYNDSVAKGHETHWINALGACISSGKQVKEVYYQIDTGHIIKFEGIFFTIKAAPNHNFELVRI